MSRKHFSVKQLISQAAVKAFDVGVLPRAAWLDVEGLEALVCDPLATALAMNSGPLSLRIYAGAPRSATAAASTRTTSLASSGARLPTPRSRG